MTRRTLFCLALQIESVRSSIFQAIALGLFLLRSGQEFHKLIDLAFRDRHRRLGVLLNAQPRKETEDHLRKRSGISNTWQPGL